MFFLTLIIFILIIGILVLVHEYGHYIAARKVGIKVEEFAIGMGPKIWGWKARPEGYDSDIEYNVRLLPIGGFVKMYGEGDYDITDKNSFGGKKPSLRLIVLVAGVFMNMLLAVGLFYIQGFKQDFQYRALQPFEEQFNPWFGQKTEAKIVVGDLTEDSLLKDKVDSLDIITKINGQDYKASEFINIVKNSKNKELTFTLNNYSNNNLKEVKVTPREGKDGKGEIGLYPTEMSYVKFEGYSKILSGFAQAANTVKYFVFSMDQIISISKEEGNITPVTDSVGGPIAIFDILGLMIVSFGFWGVLELAALFSVNLAVFNILPIPALDGGHVLFTLIEIITRKRLHTKVYNYLTIAGFILLMGFMLLVTGLDLIKLTGVRDIFCRNGKTDGFICSVSDLRR